ncbi:uncharacterized protein EI90DRAFT_3045028 [Cantharellus anzutake]|uniref:uncharacterized protein n=1 Tax=Cantharellus anzutake TaxID=1750568 RepID=UPI0019062E94|nr:uncharacterized protein EI90DRAFT_3045028 [Cantharellus anzutake]KAF8336249.1 hypothetical protein EI90DRAFT_3045028 [Cantharellus anzutake]
MSYDPISPQFPTYQYWRCAPRELRGLLEVLNTIRIRPWRFPLGMIGVGPISMYFPSRIILPSAVL